MNVLAARSLAATRLGLHAESRAARGVHRQPRFSGDGHTRHLFRPPFLPPCRVSDGCRSSSLQPLAAESVIP